MKSGKFLEGRNSPPWARSVLEHVDFLVPRQTAMERQYLFPQGLGSFPRGGFSCLVAVVRNSSDSATPPEMSGLAILGMRIPPPSRPHHPFLELRHLGPRRIISPLRLFLLRILGSPCSPRHASVPIPAFSPHPPMMALFPIPSAFCQWPLRRPQSALFPSHQSP